MNHKILISDYYLLGALITTSSYLHKASIQKSNLHLHCHLSGVPVKVLFYTDGMDHKFNNYDF